MMASTSLLQVATLLLMVMLSDAVGVGKFLENQIGEVCQRATNPARHQDLKKCDKAPCSKPNETLGLTTLTPPFLLSLPNTTHPSSLRLYSKTEDPCGVVALQWHNKTLSLKGATCNNNNNYDDTTTNQTQVPSSTEKEWLHVKVVVTGGRQVMLFHIPHGDGNGTRVLHLTTTEGCDVSYITVKPHYSNELPYGLSPHFTPINDYNYNTASGNAALIGGVVVVLLVSGWASI